MFNSIWNFVSYVFNFLQPKPLIKNNSCYYHEDLDVELKQFIDETPPKYEFLFVRD